MVDGIDLKTWSGREPTLEPGGNLSSPGPFLRAPRQQQPHAHVRCKAVRQANEIAVGKGLEKPL